MTGDKRQPLIDAIRRHLTATGWTEVAGKWWPPGKGHRRGVPYSLLAAVQSQMTREYHEAERARRAEALGEAA